MLFLNILFFPPSYYQMLVGSSFLKKKAFNMGFDILIFLCGGYPNVGLWSILQVLNVAPTNFDTFFQIQEPLKFV